jgi:hypothetical protein
MESIRSIRKIRVSNRSNRPTRDRELEQLKREYREWSELGPPAVTQPCTVATKETFFFARRKYVSPCTAPGARNPRNFSQISVAMEKWDGDATNFQYE